MLLPARFVAPILAALLLGGCKRPDPQANLEITGLEAYWAVDRASGTTNYLAPVARFHVRNKSGKPARSVQATLTFHRKGEQALTWGSDWKQIAPASAPLAPGQSVLVVMKSDARYSSTGKPETFFGHALFKDVNVEVFLREGSSPWVRFALIDVDRRIGTKELLAEAPAPGASPAVAGEPAPGASPAVPAPATSPAAVTTTPPSPR